MVFSDANAIYERDALRKLARNFADPTVGYVTGEARYLKTGEAAADVGERAYWDYEMHMKRLETQLGSMVGGDGAIYAIRRHLWHDAAGGRHQRFPEPSADRRRRMARCVRARGGLLGGDRRRHAGRSIDVASALSAGVGARYSRPARCLNPFKVGLFAWSVWSHKVLRWASGLFAAGALIGFAGLYAGWLSASPLPILMATVVAGLGVLAIPQGRRLLGMTGYFAVINAASLVGLYRGSVGRVSGVWSTPASWRGRE